MLYVGPASPRCVTARAIAAHRYFMAAIFGFDLPSFYAEALSQALNPGWHLPSISGNAARLQQRAEVPPPIRGTTGPVVIRTRAEWWMSVLALSRRLRSGCGGGRARAMGRGCARARCLPRRWVLVHGHVATLRPDLHASGAWRTHHILCRNWCVSGDRECRRARLGIPNECRGDNGRSVSRIRAFMHYPTVYIYGSCARCRRLTLLGAGALLSSDRAAFVSCALRSS